MSINSNYVVYNILICYFDNIQLIIIIIKNLKNFKICLYLVNKL